MFEDARIGRRSALVTLCCAAGKDMKVALWLWDFVNDLSSRPLEGKASA
jgi:hypothetical protein